MIDFVEMNIKYIRENPRGDVSNIIEELENRLAILKEE